MDVKAIRLLTELKNKIDSLNLQTKEIFSLEETATYLQLSKSCLYKLTSKKEIPFYSPGGKKIYFKKTEIDSWIFSSRVSSTNDIQSEVEHYLNRTNKS